jgi:hypothetical protein
MTFGERQNILVQANHGTTRVSLGDTVVAGYQNTKLFSALPGSGEGPGERADVLRPDQLRE